jgi:RNA polymerase sigma-70 factor (ECF subfamily)
MAEAKPKYPNEPEQTQWIALAKKGDNNAFCKIVNKYQRPVYNLCYQMLRNVDEAEDAAQEVFLRAYSRLNSYDDKRQFSTWLFSIASHYCIDRWRRSHIQFVSWDNLEAWSDSLADRNACHPERAMLETEAAQEVRNLLKMLHPANRIVLILKYWHMMSYQEIAQTLGTTVSAVKSRLFRARKMMAQLAAQPQKTTFVPRQKMSAVSY